MPANATIGSGPDTLVLKVSQDGWLGSAEYTISVNGVQIDGTRTASAERQLGQDDTVTVHGDFGAGPHTLTVDFLNDAWGGTPETDRNLFINGATLNGVDVSDATLSLYSGGPQSVSLVTASQPKAATIGFGPDAVVLQISQDAFQGDAQYTISIDGVQVDGILTASALRALGEADTVTVLGNFTPGPHTVTISFLNDAWQGTPETDRNLYVESVSFEGQILPNSSAAFFSGGAQTVGTFSEAISTGRGTGSGPDTLMLRISQDDWLGNAQHIIRVDGVQIDDTLTASAERQFGNYDTVYASRYFGAGEHTVTVEFLNDAWGGTPETDRNLYVESVSLNGVVLPSSTVSFLSGGVQTVATFSIAPPPDPVSLVGTDGTDRLQESPGYGDVFWGGAGADIFAFGNGLTMNPFSPSDYFITVLGTGVGAAARDVILDFEQGEDVIDLSAALQFNRRVLFVDEAFRFIGTAAFSGTPEIGGTVPPELRYEVSGDSTIIQMDANNAGNRFFGDGVADAEIELVGIFSLEGGDFIL